MITRSAQTVSNGIGEATPKGAALPSASGNGDAKSAANTSIKLPVLVLSPEWPVPALHALSEFYVHLGRSEFSVRSMPENAYPLLVRLVAATAGTSPTIKSLQGKVQKLKRKGWTPQTLAAACVSIEKEQKEEASVAQRTVQAAAKQARQEGTGLYLTRACALCVPTGRASHCNLKCPLLPRRCCSTGKRASDVSTTSGVILALKRTNARLLAYVSPWGHWVCACWQSLFLPWVS